MHDPFNKDIEYKHIRPRFVKCKGFRPTLNLHKNGQIINQVSCSSVLEDCSPDYRRLYKSNLHSEV